MDAITRIKLQKQPKKDFLKETKTAVQAAMQAQPMDTNKVAKTLPQPATAEVKPEVEQSPFNPVNVAESGLNQAIPKVSPRIPTPQSQPAFTPAPTDIQVTANQDIKQLQSDISKTHGDNTNVPLSSGKLTGVPVNDITAQTEAIQQNKQNISDINYTQKRQSNTKLTPELANEIMKREGYQGLWDAINKDSAYEGQDEIDKRDKREKQRNLITSIADGLSSIANIGGTLAGGVAQKQTSLSEANTKRRDYQRQLREKDRDKWQAMMLRTGEQQMNYGLAREKQEIERVQNALQFQYQQNRLELDRVREQRMFAKDQATIDYYDKREALLKAQEQKYLSDIENNKAKTGATIEKYKSDASANQIRAGASATNANASQQRANDNTTKTKAEIEMRKNGTWNQKSATGSSSQSKYTPSETPPPETPPKQPVKQSTPTKNTSSLGKYGFNSDNKKHKQDPFK